jgi:enoyl-[acyl-carrier protein] reductase I
MAHHLLEGKKGIIFGALNNKSIAWKVAEKAHEEGAKIVLTNAPYALRLGEIDTLAQQTGSRVVAADATKIEDLELLLKEAQEILGGKIDFILHSIGMSPNVRKKRSYDDLDYHYFQQTLDISALSFHKLLQTAKNWMPLPITDRW